MCDDLGWGDVEYYGYTPIKTPNLNDMAKSGIRFDRWYAGAPVCSPTRGSAITGRHPYRYGITFANVGKMKDQEITVAEAAKTQGYTTGHFGKWHVGTLTTEINDANRGAPGNTAEYSPPQDNGFDVCFSTESKVPTYNPMYKIGSTTQLYGTRYWREDGSFVPQDSNELLGDDSKVIMDQAIPFIEKAVDENKPFVSVIWFHTPHLPILADSDHKKPYSSFTNNEQNYYGCVAAMDEQVGRLRKKLRELGVADNTMLWFCSDNGPEGGTQGSAYPGSAGPYRGRKRSLYEGGVRVPGILEWPDKVKKTRIEKNFPCVTSDYFPTIMEVLGFKVKNQPEPIDGISLMPLIQGKITQRPSPIAFQSDNQISLTDNRYKIYSNDSGVTFELYDLMNDPSEATNLADESEHATMIAEMKTKVLFWRDSCTASNNGDDYKS
ncbi:MAG: sulfatase-like hydrolase/transferase [Phycisphaerae bacterium]|nr:sulfatase-like hydrolase/transferase [Phycisphaerae bacterium]